MTMKPKVDRGRVQKMLWRGIQSFILARLTKLRDRPGQGRDMSRLSHPGMAPEAGTDRDNPL